MFSTLEPFVCLFFVSAELQHPSDTGSIDRCKSLHVCSVLPTCTCVCLFVCLFITHTVYYMQCMHVCLCVCFLHACVFVCLFLACVCVCVFVSCMCVCLFLACMCVCVFVSCMHACVFVCLFVACILCVCLLSSRADPQHISSCEGGGVRRGRGGGEIRWLPT